MILDERTEFADATSVGTPNNATVNVGDVIDTSVARDLGNGQPVYLVVQVTADITSGGAATISFLLVSDSVAPPAVDGTQTVHWESAIFPLATVVAGHMLVIALPLEDPDYERYLGVQVRNNAAFAVTGGAINAFLTLDPHGTKAYADAVN